MSDWLRGVKMLRREAEPEPEFVVELFDSAAPRFTCPQCGVVGLAASLVERDEWTASRPCQRCGEPIPVERLQAVPWATTCVRCQGAQETGADAGPREFCEDCGAVLQVRPARGGGIARYAMRCPDCGRQQ